ncbi:MAG: hypothetical protein WBZ36_19375 [Candidatus Nitrosopolaris sp.]
MGRIVPPFRQSYHETISDLQQLKCSEKKGNPGTLSDSNPIYSGYLIQQLRTKLQAMIRSVKQQLVGI